MPTYTVLYAEDVPHYGTRDIEAATDEQAIAAAKAIDHDDLGNITTDADHHNTVTKRIVHIERDDGLQILNDAPLDDFRLRNGGEPDRLLCDAAPQLAEALSKACVLLDRIAETLHYEDGLPVTALESRDIEIMHGDAITELPAIKAALAAAGRPV